MKYNLLVALSVFFLSLTAVAESRYVSDSMYIPIRSGGGNQFRIVNKGIKSGTKLTLIEAPAGSEWSHIKTPGGTEGWIRNQYLKKTPTAQIKLKEIHAKLAKSTQRIAELETSLKEIKSDHTSLSSTANKQSKEHKDLSERYAQLKTLSADAVSLSHRYKELLTKHELLKTEFDTAHAENDRLKSDRTINQWLFGAGLIILGMILMLILPSLKPQKGNGDWVN